MPNLTDVYIFGEYVGNDYDAANIGRVVVAGYRSRGRRGYLLSNLA